MSAGVLEPKRVPARDRRAADGRKGTHARIRRRTGRSIQGRRAPLGAGGGGAMPVFEYTARNLKGNLVQDKIDLPSRDDVIAHLRKNRMAVLQVRQPPKEISLGALFKGGVKTRDIVVFMRHVPHIINSSLPLAQPLD